MANSRKSINPNNAGCEAAFERALGDILARVFAFTGGAPQGLAVAYSGGLDSSVLLHLAARHAAARGLRLYAFHVHHGLSRNADRWSAHCRAEAERLHAVYDEVRVKLDNPERGIEDAARAARYAALGDMCRRHGVRLLLSAHHQDDQAETVLLQLMRGAGLPGLSGMAALQPAHDLLGPGVALGRPLLELGRAALDSEAHRLGLTHVVDESNRDTRFRRNAIRHDVAPVLEQHFPGFAVLVGRSAVHAQDAQTLLDQLAAIDLEHCRADAEAAGLAIARLRRLSPERIDNLLRFWLRREGVGLPSSARLDEVRRQMLDAAADLHPFFDFGPVRLHRVAGKLELHPRLGTPPAGILPLQWGGRREVPVPQWRGRLLFEPAPGGIDPELLRSGRLSLRARSGRERLKTAANRPSRSLKNLFQESAIAPWRRVWLPLLYRDDSLIFVAGLGMDARLAAAGEGIALRWESEG